MSDRPQWVVTASAKPGDVPYPGSVIRWCSICACNVWLSPAAIARMDDDHQLKPVCLDCAIPMMAQEESVIGNAVDPSAPGATQAKRMIQRMVHDARKEGK